MQPYCSYYGRLNGELYGRNIGLYMVDDAFGRIVDKHEKSLIKLQEIIKNSFTETIKVFNKRLDILSERIAALEMNKSKPKTIKDCKHAISEGNESKE